MTSCSHEALLQILGRLDLDSASAQMVLMACAPQQLTNHDDMVGMLGETLFVCRPSMLLRLVF